MKISDIEAGTKLELDIYNIFDEKVKRNLKSEFEWVDEDGEIVIAVPIYEGKLYPVYTGSTVDVFFVWENKLYTFKAKVAQRGIRENNVDLLKIRAVSDIARIQKRQFFRFQCSVPVKYRLVDSFDGKSNSEGKYKSTFTRDISGGGICISMEEKLSKDQGVECELSLDAKKMVHFFGVVLRVGKNENSEINRYDVGICFKKIQSRDREDIIKFIFSEQRKLRKKGLI